MGLFQIFKRKAQERTERGFDLFHQQLAWEAEGARAALQGKLYKSVRMIQ